MYIINIEIEDNHLREIKILALILPSWLHWISGHCE